ncbi:MAG: hypothetical protein SFV51_08010 [Bryobacteraceae bacterium]|nr:hypothetical protein [Bryobacteraceae bacterium]
MKHKAQVTTRRRGNQRGIEVTEFALFSILLIPLFLGTMSVGIALGKTIQTAQVARDAGHMFVRQVDFSQSQNKELIVRIARGMNMTATGGEGVVILSQVLMIGASECAALPTGTACDNQGYPVIVQRLAIGNSSQSFYTSTVGNPPASLLDSQGKASPADYLTDPSLRANTLTNADGTGLLTLANSERTYIAEAYFKAPELAFLNHGQPLAMYSRNYF